MLKNSRFKFLDFLLLPSQFLPKICIEIGYNSASKKEKLHQYLLVWYSLFLVYYWAILILHFEQTFHIHTNLVNLPLKNQYDSLTFLYVLHRQLSEKGTNITHKLTFKKFETLQFSDNIFPFRIFNKFCV